MHLISNGTVQVSAEDGAWKTRAQEGGIFGFLHGFGSGSGQKSQTVVEDGGVERAALAHTVQACFHEESIGKIGIGFAIGRKNTDTGIVAGNRENGSSVRCGGDMPAMVSIVEAAEGIRDGIEEHSTFAHMSEDTSGESIDGNGCVLDGGEKQMNMQTAARLSVQRFWREIGGQTILCGDGGNGIAEGEGVVGGTERIAALKIDLILSGPRLMVGGEWHHPHLFHGKTNIAPEIFPAVERSDVHVSGRVLRLWRGVSVGIVEKQIEFEIGADIAKDTELFGVLYGLFEEKAAVGFIGSGVLLAADLAEHTYNAAVGGAPGEWSEGIRLRDQEQTRITAVLKARDLGSANHIAGLHHMGELRGHDGDIFRSAEGVRKSKTDEFYILFLYILENFLFCIMHLRNLLYGNHE